MEIFKQEYCDESLCDVNRDISEAFDPSFNNIINAIPTNPDGFKPGKFIITITWEDD